jgi:hypothetical protein
MMNPISQIIAGSLLLSIIHASVPNHWLPLVVIGKTEKWGRAETLGVTAIAGFAHTASTLIIGILVGWLGYQLTSRRAFITGIVAPAFSSSRFVYLAADWRRRGHHHHHDHDAAVQPAPKTAVITSLVVAMFFAVSD